VQAPGLSTEALGELYTRLAAASPEEQEIATTLLEQTLPELPRKARAARRKVLDVLDAAERLAR
jgi:hypothetical protein